MNEIKGIEREREKERESEREMLKERKREMGGWRFGLLTASRS